ncbi:hypothetical protein HWD99_01840 [Microbacterium sp. C5A9]|uniref:hypothetical protein n=1 Tax=Microbacterium sp. C5A9 TaxID=2736663 RepID=UPI001F5194B3|nr:hypothetical protein [Microbacterium sp. C5A9]MCI1017359.1 hypothetical protein [Microbacterium sp. C5A9]
MGTTANFQVLRHAVIDASVADRWKTALLEWEVISVEEHPTSEGECVCGQTNLLWMYTIANDANGRTLFPIGSTCVNHFGRTDLNRQITVFRKLLLVRDAAKSGSPITMDTNFFSRAALSFLYEEGVFTPDAYNFGDGWNDYDFLLKMFGVRDKDAITSKQRWKIRKLIDLKITPFVLTDSRLG